MCVEGSVQYVQAYNSHVGIKMLYVVKTICYSNIFSIYDTAVCFPHQSGTCLKENVLVKEEETSKSHLLGLTVPH